MSYCKIFTKVICLGLFYMRLNTSRQFTLKNRLTIDWRSRNPLQMFKRPALKHVCHWSLSSKPRVLRKLHNSFHLCSFAAPCTSAMFHGTLWSAVFSTPTLLNDGFIAALIGIQPVWSIYRENCIGKCIRQYWRLVAVVRSTVANSLAYCLLTVSELLIVTWWKQTIHRTMFRGAVIPETYKI